MQDSCYPICIHTKSSWKRLKINIKKFQKVLSVSPYSSLNYIVIYGFNESLEDGYCYANWSFHDNYAKLHYETVHFLTRLAAYDYNIISLHEVEETVSTWINKIT